MTAKYRIMVLALITVFALPVFQSRAAEIKAVKIWSESDETRITIELDNTIQYQTQYDSEHNICMTLLETAIGSVNRVININDKLAETVTLKEIADNIVYVKISLKKPAAFAIYPLGLPDRIIVDITPIDVVAATGAQGAESGISSSEPVAADEAQSHTTTRLPSSKAQGMGYKLVQFCFDVIVIAALIGMGIMFRRYARTNNENHRTTLKKNEVFADIIDVESRPSQGSGAQILKKLRGVFAHKTDASQALESPRTRGSEQRVQAFENPRVRGDQSKKEGMSVPSVSEAQKKKEHDKDSVSFPKQYEKVYELAQRGMDRRSISQKSHVPIGEVNLILDLSKARAEARAE